MPVSLQTNLNQGSRKKSFSFGKLDGLLTKLLLTLFQVVEEGFPDVVTAREADNGGEGESQPAGTATTPAHEHQAPKALKGSLDALALFGAVS